MPRPKRPLQIFPIQEIKRSMKLDRLLAVTLLLLNRRHITARELARRFEISLRTVYRDVDALNRAGVPVISLQGQGGGYALPDTYKLRHQLFTHRDMIHLLATLKGINQNLEHREIQRTIQKIETLLPKEGQAPPPGHIPEDPSPTLVLDILPWGNPHRAGQWLPKIQTALDSRRTLNFRYQGPHSPAQSREVEPHTLVFKGYGWYLLAFCRLRQDMRIFKLARMTELAVTANRFIRRALPRPAGEYFAPDRDSRPRLDIVLDCEPALRPRLEESLPAQDLEDRPDGRIRVRLSLPEDPWLHGFLLSMGPEVEVVSPPALRQRLAKKIQAMTKKYNS